MRGTNMGVPGYDQRGYDTNGSRDIGAYEVDGIVAYYFDPDAPLTSAWVGSSTIENAVDQFMGATDPNVHYVELVSTRILEDDISISVSKAFPVKPFVEARTVYVKGHRDGGTVISGGGVGQLLDVSGHPDVKGELYLDRVTFADGYSDFSGAALTTGGSANLFLTDVAFVNNISAFYGGAVYTSSDKVNVNIDRALFADNIALGGGGALASVFKGSATVNAATFANNLAYSGGGAVYIGGGATATLTGSTLAKNTAFGGGGGVFTNGELTSGNTIYAKNISVLDNDGNDYYVYYDEEGETKAKLSNDGYNLVEHQNGTFILEVSEMFFGQTSPEEKDKHDVMGSQAYLFATEKLADYGGWSYSMALDQNSAALEKGTGTANDQRNYGVFQGKDIGAFEHSGTVATLRSEDRPLVDGNSYFTISDAIAAAVDGDTVVLNNARIMENDILIGHNITIEVTEAETFGGAVIDSNGYGRGFFIEGNLIEATINDVLLTNGLILSSGVESPQQGGGTGGGIFNAGTIILENVSVFNAFAQLSGGGIYSTNSLTVMSNDASVNFMLARDDMPAAYRQAITMYQSNRAGASAGAIYASGTAGQRNGLQITDADFYYNKAYSGGAVFAENVFDPDSADMISNVNFVANNATHFGGALYFSGGGDVNISSTDFTYNSAMSTGGAIYIASSNPVTFTNSNIDYNYAFNDAGALFFDGIGATDGGLTLIANGATSVSDNESLSGMGGALYVINTNLLHLYSTSHTVSLLFEENYAHDVDGDDSGLGGAIYYNGGTAASDLVIGNGADGNAVQFNYNYARNKGGAIYMENSGDFTARQNILFYLNSTHDDGGALYILDSQRITMSEHVVADGNVASNSGGAFYFENVHDIVIDYLELGTNNYINEGYEGSANGGAVFIKNVYGNITLSNIDAFDNSTATLGGAFYIENDQDSVISISNSGFYRNSAAGGSAVYIDHASDLRIVNTTFGYNSGGGAALYLGYGNLVANYVTFANNTGGANANSIYLPGAIGQDSSFQINNSLINDYEAFTFGDVGIVDITLGANTNNIFTHSHQYTGAGNLTDGTKNDIRVYQPYDDNYPNGATGVYIGALDGYNNIVGTALTADSIDSNLYLSNEMTYHANFLTRAFALESRNSIAYRYELNGVEVRPGESDSAVKYDQRGNLRSGVNVYSNAFFSPELWSNEGSSVYSYSLDLIPENIVDQLTGTTLNQVVLPADITDLAEGEWAWDETSNTAYVHLSGDVDPGTLSSNTMVYHQQFFVYNQMGNYDFTANEWSETTTSNVYQYGTALDAMPVTVGEGSDLVYVDFTTLLNGVSELAEGEYTFDTTTSNLYVRLSDNSNPSELNADEFNYDNSNNFDSNAWFEARNAAGVYQYTLLGNSPYEVSDHRSLEYIDTTYDNLTEGQWTWDAGSGTVYVHLTGDADPGTLPDSVMNHRNWTETTLYGNGVEYSSVQISADDVRTSIGAFEANFYTTVSSGDDNTSNPDWVIHTPGQEWHDIDAALTKGITLREGIFWMDTYNIDGLAESGDAEFDADRYIKFSDEVQGREITLTAGQINARTDFTLGMIDQYQNKSYTDAEGETHYFMADNTFIGQDDADRIIISGGDANRIFNIQTRSDFTELVYSSGWEFTTTAGFNNMTLSNGYVDTSGKMWGFNTSNYGRGGAIYNTYNGTVFMNNTVIQDSHATNLEGAADESNTGFGGGIYNAGEMTIVDSTITGNKVDNPDVAFFAGYGGGIYNSGTLTVKRSLISNNTADGDYDPLINSDVGTGGGIYSRGDLYIYSTTITENDLDDSDIINGAALTIAGGNAELVGNTIAFNDSYQTTENEYGFAVSFTGGTIEFRNNIVAQNYVEGTSFQFRRDMSVLDSVTFAESNNIIGAYQFGTGYYDFASQGTDDILGDNQSGEVEKLNISGDLLHNGGMTRNYRVQSDSIAIQNAYDYLLLGIDYDQRNLVVDGATGQERDTIGAYELLTYVTLRSDVPDQAIIGGDVLYQYSYFAADGMSGRQAWLENVRYAMYLSDQGGRVEIEVIPDHETYLLEYGELEILNGITVTTTDIVDTLTIDGGWDGVSESGNRILSITDPTTQASYTVTLEHLDLINGYAAADDRNGHGGGIFSTEQLVL